VRVAVPPGVDRLVVEAPTLEAHGLEDALRWTARGRHGVAAAGEPLVLPPATSAAELRLERRGALDPAAIRPPARSHWAVARRLLSETRDRTEPAARRLSRPAG
jgi:hypothetical protein